MKTKIKLMTGMIGMIILSMAAIFMLSSFKAASESGKAKLALEIRTYLDRNVKPIMQPQRVKLDQLLSAEERKQVNALNSRLRALIEKRNKSGIGFLVSDEFSFSQAPVYTNKQKADQKSSHDEIRRIMAQAWAIADKHEADISRLMNEKTSFYGTWQRGITALVKEYLDDKFYMIGSKQLAKRIENRDIVKYYTPVAFLLWDPQQRFIPDELLK